MVGLLSLPDELLVFIVRDLDSQPSILNLAKTSRRLFNLAISELYCCNALAASLKREERYTNAQRDEEERSQEDSLDGDFSDYDSDMTLGSAGDEDDLNGEAELYRLDDQAIYWAIDKGRLDTLQRAQDAGVATNDFRLVRLAATTGNLTILEHLLQDSQNAHHLTDKSGSRLIEVASRGGHVKVVEKLFDLGATISVQPWRSLHAAAVAQYMMDDDDDDDEDEADVKCKLLIRLLIENGANTNALNGEGETALYCAIRNGSTSACAALLDHGADINALDSGGQTMLMAAIMMRRDCSKTSLLLQRGADVMRRDREGNLPLTVAVEWSSKMIIQMLLQRNADANAANDSGCTPLLVAAARGEAETIWLLLEFGAEVDRVASCGCTPLMHACQNGNLDAIQILLRHGADITNVSGPGSTILHLVADSGRHPATELVIQHWKGLLGNDTSKSTTLPVDEVDPLGRTALFYAARAGASQVVQLLLDAGASAHIKDRFGATPVFAAARNGHAEAARILLAAYPAGIDETDVFGFRLIDWAVDCGPTDLVKLVNKYKGEPVITKMPGGFYGPSWHDFRVRDSSCAVCVRRLKDVQLTWWCDGCKNSTAGRQYAVCRPCAQRTAVSGVSKCLDESHADEGDWNEANFPRRGCFLTTGVRPATWEP